LLYLRITGIDEQIDDKYVYITLLLILNYLIDDILYDKYHNNIKKILDIQKQIQTDNTRLNVIIYRMNNNNENSSELMRVQTMRKNFKLLFDEKLKLIITNPEFYQTSNDDLYVLDEVEFKNNITNIKNLIENHVNDYGIYIDLINNFYSNFIKPSLIEEKKSKNKDQLNPSQAQVSNISSIDSMIEKAKERNRKKVKFFIIQIPKLAFKIYIIKYKLN